MQSLLRRIFSLFLIVLIGLPNTFAERVESPHRSETEVTVLAGISHVGSDGKVIYYPNFQTYRDSISSADHRFLGSPRTDDFKWSKKANCHEAKTMGDALHCQGKRIDSLRTQYRKDKYDALVGSLTTQVHNANSNLEDKNKINLAEISSKVIKSPVNHQKTSDEIFELFLDEIYKHCETGKTEGKKSKCKKQFNPDVFSNIKKYIYSIYKLDHPKSKTRQAEKSLKQYFDSKKPEGSNLVIGIDSGPTKGELSEYGNIGEESREVYDKSQVPFELDNCSQFFTANNKDLVKNKDCLNQGLADVGLEDSTLKNLYINVHSSTNLTNVSTGIDLISEVTLQSMIQKYMYTLGGTFDLNKLRDPLTGETFPGCDRFETSMRKMIDKQGAELQKSVRNGIPNALADPIERKAEMATGPKTGNGKYSCPMNSRYRDHHVVPFDQKLTSGSDYLECIKFHAHGQGESSDCRKKRDLTKCSLHDLELMAKKEQAKLDKKRDELSWLDRGWGFNLGLVTYESKEHRDNCTDDDCRTYFDKKDEVEKIEAQMDMFASRMGEITSIFPELSAKPHKGTGRGNFFDGYAVSAKIRESLARGSDDREVILSATRRRDELEDEILGTMRSICRAKYVDDRDKTANFMGIGNKVYDENGIPYVSWSDLAFLPVAETVAMSIDRGDENGAFHGILNCARKQKYDRDFYRMMWTVGFTSACVAAGFLIPVPAANFAVGAVCMGMTYEDVSQKAEIAAGRYSFQTHCRNAFDSSDTTENYLVTESNGKTIHICDSKDMVKAAGELDKALDDLWWETAIDGTLGVVGGLALAKSIKLASRTPILKLKNKIQSKIPGSIPIAGKASRAVDDVARDLTGLAIRPEVKLVINVKEKLKGALFMLGNAAADSALVLGLTAGADEIQNTAAAMIALKMFTSYKEAAKGQKIARALLEAPVIDEVVTIGILASEGIKSSGRLSTSTLIAQAASDALQEIPAVERMRRVLDHVEDGAGLNKLILPPKQEAGVIASTVQEVTGGYRGISSLSRKNNWFTTGMLDDIANRVRSFPDSTGLEQPQRVAEVLKQAAKLEAREGNLRGVRRMWEQRRNAKSFQKTLDEMADAAGPVSRVSYLETMDVLGDFYQRGLLSPGVMQGFDQHIARFGARLLSTAEVVGHSRLARAREAVTSFTRGQPFFRNTLRGKTLDDVAKLAKTAGEVNRHYAGFGEELAKIFKRLAMLEKESFGNQRLVNEILKLVPRSLQGEELLLRIRALMTASDYVVSEGSRLSKPLDEAIEIILKRSDKNINKYLESLESS